jgi:hypothetical protein
MSFRFFIVFTIIFLLGIMRANGQMTFRDDVINPQHETPSFIPKTSDYKGYTELMNTLIRWEVIRSMYDYKFSGSISQIKHLSEITKSEFGKGMFHYFEGIRGGLGDPLRAETNFLQALDYFKANQDTSGILHTAMHLLRVNLNTTMINIGRIERYTSLYEDLMSLENHLKIL